MSNAAEIIAALSGNQHTGMCCCPAHDDSTPSLKVSEQHGKVLFFCHAGCSQDEVIQAFKAKAGMRWNNKPSPPPLRINKIQDNKMETQLDAYDKFRQAWTILRMAAGAIGLPHEWSKVQKPIEYLKHRGIDVVPESVMLLPRARSIKLQKAIPGFKPFPAMVAPIIGPSGLQGAHVTYLTRDGSGNLRGKESTKNIRRIYGAMKGGYVQLGTIDRDKPPKQLLVAEGVETALSAVQLIECPTIAVLSASNFANVTPPKCKELLIASDRDESDVGLRAAEEAGGHWASQGYSVSVALPPKPFKDWNDAVQDPKADPERLRDLLLDGLMLDPEEREARSLTMAELMDRNFPPREYLLRPWLAVGSLAMLHAQRGAGKTRFNMSVAYAVATGQSILGWQADRPVRVLYVDGELPAPLLQQWVRQLGPETPNLRFLSRDILQRGGLTLPDLAEEEGREFLDRIIKRDSGELLILDSLSTLIRSGVENDAESWAPVQDWLLRLRFDGRTVMLIHHEGVSGRQRGTSKREDVLDTVIRLERKDNAEGDDDDVTTCELTFRKNREFFGADAAAMVLRLTTRTGVVEWTHELQRDHIRERVLQLRHEGWLQKDIATELDISQGWVSQILRGTKRRKENISPANP